MARLPVGIVVGSGPVSAFAAALLMLATLWVPSPAPRRVRCAASRHAWGSP